MASCCQIFSVKQVCLSADASRHTSSETKSLSQPAQSPDKNVENTGFQLKDRTSWHSLFIACQLFCFDLQLC